MTMLPINATPEHLRALARSSFPFFCRGSMQTLLPATPILSNWHLDLIANKCEDVMAGRIRRLIVNIPPRYGKSLIASVSFPAFILGHRPTAEVVCISYSADLAEKMAGDTRRLMNSGYYQGLFGQRLTSSRSRLGELKTPEGGGRLATSVEGTITGRGGNFIIIDDPLRPADARSDVKREAVNRWFDSTIVSRPNNKETDAIIIIMQRLHEDDLVGHLIAQGHWDVLSLPLIAEEDEVHEVRTPFGIQIYRRKAGEALHPARESLARIAELRAAMSPYDFAAQGQQRPAPAGGGDIQVEWFRTYPAMSPPKFTRKIQSWDTAAKDGDRADFSACVTLGETADRQWYIIDVYRERLLFPELKRKIRELAELHEVATVLIEDSSSGTQLFQELRYEGFARLEPIRPKGSKYERMIACTAMIEGGKVWWPDQAHWRGVFEHELMMFPNGKHDDQVDALSQGLRWIADTSGPAHWLWAMDEIERRRNEQG
jgi:predicted phage terminase large subunit-like protein